MWSVREIPTHPTLGKINIGTLPSFKSPAVSRYLIVLSYRKKSLGDAGNINQLRGCGMSRGETDELGPLCPEKAVLSLLQTICKG